MTAFYSEFDPKAAAWLRELIKQGHIANGYVDERDLWDVSPDDLRGFDQVHLCAGIGVWSYAARRAGLADTDRFWTASFPCQPFSQAGKGKGFADERHLWPAGLHLIRECRPDLLFGEQVSSPDGLAWLDLIQADLEGEGYAVGAADTCAAGVGAPHIRQRLYWVAERLADAKRGDGRGQYGIGMGGPPRTSEGGPQERQRLRADPADGGPTVGLADDDARSQGRLVGGHGATERPAGSGGVAGGLADADGGHPGSEWQQRGWEQRQQPQDGGAGRLVDPDDAGWKPGQRDDQAAGHRAPSTATSVSGRPGPTNGLWRDADWLFCRDGKFRPVRPGSFPLVDGAPARVVRLRGYGNAVVAPAAQAWIESYLDARADRCLRLGVFA